MPALKKPKSITVTIGDRKEKEFKSFVVYDSNVEELEKLIKKALLDKK